MSFFGKILAEVVEGACDVVTLGVAITSDVVKSPVRIFNKLEPDMCSPDEDFTEDTQEAIEAIKSK